MKKIYLSVFFAVICATVIAQTPIGTWGKSYGGTLNEDNVHFTMDADKNILLAGGFSDTLIDFNPGSGINKLSPAGSYFTKLDSSGNFLWVKRIGASNISDIVTDSTGNFYVFGFTSNFNVIDIDPGAAIYNVTDVSFVAKYDMSGNFLWAKEFSTYNPGNIIIDRAGNIIISGTFSSICDFDPGSGVFNLTPTGNQANYYITKLDLNGNFLWAKAIAYGGSNGQKLNMAVDKFNNIFLLGTFDGTRDVDPGSAVYNFTAKGLQDIFVCKLNSIGNFLWADQFGGTSCNIQAGTANSLGVNEDGDVFFTVFFNNYVDFDPTNSTFFLGSGSSGFDIGLCRLSSSGGLIWAKMIGGTSGDERVSSISLNSSKIYLTGRFYTSFGTDFDAGPGTNILYTNTSSIDVFVCEYDTYGNFSKVCSFGSSGVDVGEDILSRGNGAVYLIGTFNFGFTYSPNISLGSNGANDIFICKLSGFNTSSNVWPGDANSDGTADNLDVLELGLHYMQTGAPRASVSNTWQSYFANNWAGTISNGKNLNHSDCNGDGTIDDNDTLAIFNNYGLTHAFKPEQTNTVNPQLSIVPDQASVLKGTWGTASIYLGDASVNINTINGVAFTVDFDNTLIEANSIYIEYQNSFLDAGQNLHFRKLDFANGKIFTATTHTINNNVSGNGLIAKLHYQIKSNLTTDEVLNIGLSQANQSNASGVITPVTTGTGTLMAIGASVGLQELNGNMISISPNPTNGSLTIRSKTELQKIEVITVTGQILLSETPTNVSHTVQLDDFANGIYFVNLYQNNRIVKREKVVLNK